MSLTDLFWSKIKMDIRPAFGRDRAYSNSRAFAKQSRHANGLIRKSVAFTKHITGNQLYKAM